MREIVAVVSSGAKHTLRDRLGRFRIFDPAEYVSLNPDLNSISDPLEHYVDHGLWENRTFVRSNRLLRAASLVLCEPMESQTLAIDAATGILSRAHELNIGIYVHSGGSALARELAEGAARGLQSVGVRAAVLDEHASIEDRPETCIFVAPHDFFLLGGGEAWAREDVIESSFMLATEEIGTPAFNASLRFLLSARGIIDPHPQSQRMFAEAGVPTIFYFPGYDPSTAPDTINALDHPLGHALPKLVQSHDQRADIWADRPLDLAFFGVESRIREDFLSANAPFLSSMPCFIHQVRSFRLPPFASDKNLHPTLGRVLGHLSKIVLHIHPGEMRLFDWHRMAMQGMWQRALVVSTPCLPHPLFKPGVHYLEEIPRRIPKLIRWLLNTAQGRATGERVRHEAFVTLTEQVSMSRVSLALARFLLSAGPNAARGL